MTNDSMNFRNLVATDKDYRDLIKHARRKLDEVEEFLFNDDDESKIVVLANAKHKCKATIRRTGDHTLEIDGKTTSYDTREEIVITFIAEIME